MAPSAIHFMHLADLHLSPCPRTRTCGEGDPACDACIKATILDGLAARFDDARTRPDLVLLAGDLTDLSEGYAGARGLNMTAEPLTRFVARARARGVVVAGVTGEHDGDDSTRTFRKRLGWDWLLRSGEVNDKTGVPVYGVEGRPKQAGVGDDIRAVEHDAAAPGVLLAHADWPKVPREHASAFSYCALGHLHWLKLGPVSAGGRTMAGYPGHLFSYWDGCGKAWPVHAITGEIYESGRVRVNALPLSLAAGAPETRRMYVDASEGGQSRGTLVFENPPDARFFADLGVQAQFEEHLDPAFGNVYRRVARVRFTSVAQLEGLLRAALERCPGDVFVTPATGRGWSDRVKTWGRAVTGEVFSEFVEKTFKKSDKTALVWRGGTWRRTPGYTLIVAGRRWRPATRRSSIESVAWRDAGAGERVRRVFTTEAGRVAIDAELPARAELNQPQRSAKTVRTCAFPGAAASFDDTVASFIWRYCAIQLDARKVRARFAVIRPTVRGSSHSGNTLRTSVRPL